MYYCLKILDDTNILTNNIIIQLLKSNLIIYII